MKFEKIFKDQLDHGYAVMRLQAEGRDFALIASEENQPCYAYDLDDNFKRYTVWPDVGGTMTMVQLPGTLNFVATQKFYPGFNSPECRIVKETWNGNGWDQTIVGDFPYVHRFDVIKKKDGQGYWFIGCSIANSKKSIDDWSDPGKIWVGEYDDEKESVTQHALDIRIVKNHGYKRMDGYSLITGVEGIFKLTWPTSGHDWQLEQLSEIETSDIFSADVNGDGKQEYLTIEGFHGPYLRISNDQFETISLSGAETPFGHAIWGGKLNDGKEYFIFGWRDGKQDLELITDDQLDAQLIAQKFGPSNVIVYEKDGKQYLLSANRESNEVAIYSIEPTK